MNFKESILKRLKKKSRIYIFPTRMGSYLNGLLFLMFLLAVGYNNNLLLIFTLFLFTFNLMWVVQTHVHLQGLKFSGLMIESAHAGSKRRVQVNWENAPDGPLNFQLELHGNERVFKLEHAQDFKDRSYGQVLIPERGLYRFEYLKITSSRPFGLYRAWIYLPIDAVAWAYPRLLSSSEAPAAIFSDIEGDRSTLKSGSHDVWNLTRYDDHDSRKISWKHYARSGELVVKEGEDLRKSEVKFSYDENDVRFKELNLSRIATQIKYCSDHEMTWALRVPGKVLPGGFGKKHLDECMKELTLC